MALYVWNKRKSHEQMLISNKDVLSEIFCKTCTEIVNQFIAYHKISEWMDREMIQKYKK